MQVKLFIWKPVEINSPKDGETRISIIYQELILVPYLSVAENMFLGKEPMSKIPGKIDFEKCILNQRKC